MKYDRIGKAVTQRLASCRDENGSTCICTVHLLVLDDVCLDSFNGASVDVTEVWDYASLYVRIQTEVEFLETSLCRVFSFTRCS